MRPARFSPRRVQIAISSSRSALSTALTLTQPVTPDMMAPLVQFCAVLLSLGRHCRVAHPEQFQYGQEEVTIE
jgi:hypothetical protein